ncbi:MAG: AAA family ATPase [Lachnospiraceae bacterium]|nr:AAA family ATPase [Lachnospiraceae bacterium]
MSLMNIKVTFNGNWVLTKQEEPYLPAEVLSEELSTAFPEQFSVNNLSLTELSVQVDTDSKIEHIRKQVRQLLMAKYPMDRIDRVSEIIITGAEGETDILVDIDNLIGWDNFKELCHEIAQVTPQIKKNRTYEAFQFQNYLFSVNDGCGLSTVLDKFYSFVTGLNLFEGKNGVFELELTTDKESETGTTPIEALSLLDMDDATGSLFCFDISNFMERSKYPMLKEFLQSLLELEKEYIFAFRIPFVEEGALRDVYEMLSDILFMRKIPVLPFSMDQLKSHAKDMLETYQYEGSDDVWEVFESRIAQEKSDGKFYGLQTVDKVVYEMLWLKNKADSYLDQDTTANDTSETVNEGLTDEKEVKLKSISQSEVIELAPTFMQEQVTGFDELNEMVGMEKIADRIKEIVAQVKLSQSNNTMERPSIHMRFLGSPGTGKTTVARIVGKIFQENGILRNGYFFEYTARDLVGEYVGQTAPKTASICRDAYGSVLFIDEAYGLYWGNDRGNDFGREALTTLISEMENHRDDMVVIMAGYKDEMEGLMKGNPGLRSRMPFLIEFPSYTPTQLAAIFMQMVNKHFKYDESLAPAVTEYFDSLPKEYLESKEFANGRFVRNLYERTWSKAALRMQLNKQGEVVLSVEDFKAACEEKEFSEKLERKKTIGFSN